MPRSRTRPHHEPEDDEAHGVGGGLGVRAAPTPPVGWFTHTSNLVLIVMMEEESGAVICECERRALAPHHVVVVVVVVADAAVSAGVDVDVGGRELEEAAAASASWRHHPGFFRPTGPRRGTRRGAGRCCQKSPFCFFVAL